MHIKQVLIDCGIPFSSENGMVICDQHTLDLNANQITSLDGFTFNGRDLDLDDNPINIETIITREIWEREYADPYVNMFLNCSSRPRGAGN